MEGLYHEPNRLGLILSAEEARHRFPSLDHQAWRSLESQFPVRITRSWADRMESASGPLGLQVMPRAEELIPDPEDVPDPVGEQGRMPVPWVVQKHDSRALLLLTRRCHLHCRYCFRRELPGAGEPSDAELETAIQYLIRSGVHEVILSGGDPLVVRNTMLDRVLEALRPAVPVVRIHTRAPITFPARVTPELVDVLRRHSPIWVVVHANHPAELSEEVCQGLAMLIDAGIPVHNQAVLLKGVNDDVDTLVGLVQRLVELRVRPYYLHHPDAVPGNSHLRVTVEAGLQLYDALRRRVSGLALPQYVIDPPDGTGKVPVAEWVSSSVPSR